MVTASVLLSLSLSLSLVLSFSLSDRDAKPHPELPECHGAATSSQSQSSGRPAAAQHYGKPDARHDGPVSFNAFLSGNTHTHTHVSMVI